MTILSHRGFWGDENLNLIAPKNSLESFNASFKNNFGSETDLRDLNGKIVISHDPAIDSSDTLTLEDFFKTYKKYKKDLPLALNIKADGLQVMLKELLLKYEIKNYFVFDMSVPDALVYLKHKFNVFTRQSEYEQTPSFYKKAYGVWLDEFKTHWINKKIIKQHLNNNKLVCIVSPDLHKRSFLTQWREYRKIFRTLNNKNLMLCTDFPQLAYKYFNANKQEAKKLESKILDSSRLISANNGESKWLRL